MKIGYKIILGVFSLILLYYPSHTVFNKYSQFKELQTKESKSLLQTFKTRPEKFYANPSYELSVKSFIEKDIKNINIDLNSADVPLKVPMAETTAGAIDMSQTSASSISTTVVSDVSTTTETIEIKPIVKEAQKPLETKAKEPETKVVIAGTPVQDKKVDELKYYVQLGVFKSQENANNLLRKVGSGFVVVKSGVNDKQYIVRSNPGSKEEIESLSNKVIKKDSSITPIVRVW